ncbi:MAG: hypothetical protein H6Q11_1683 [Acidobacteria bacterium]|nr:hypothetical protein [Acidobacteriota bacterium]
MADTRPALSRTVTLRSPAGQPVMRVGLLPAALAGLAALAFFPRVTALALLAAWLRRLSLSIDG